MMPPFDWTPTWAMPGSAARCSSLSRQEYQRAVDDLDELVRDDPDDAEGLAYRGRALLRAGQYGRALADLESAVALGLRQPWVLCDCGNARSGLEDHEGAIADYDEVLRQIPGDAVTLMNRGRSLFRYRNFDRALADFETVISLSPDDWLAHHWVAEVHYQREDYDLALDIYDRSLGLHGDNPDLYLSRGLCHKANDDHAAAVDDFSELLRLRPADYLGLLSRVKGGTMGWVSVADMKKLREVAGLLQVSFDHVDQLLSRSGPFGRGLAVGVNDVKADMPFDDLRHEAVHRPPDRRLW
jgi:tetratricopeptide (TPR) repeat protein